MEHNEIPVQPDSFETGSTNPPKKRGGIVAVLLITVIFLAGFLRILSLLNIGLFPPQPGDGADILSTVAEDPLAGAPDPGFSGQTVTELTERFHHCPKGVMVNRVTPGSGAQRAGIAEGDVLVQLDGKAIADTAALRAALQSRKPGDLVTAVFARGGISYTCQLTLSNP